MTKELSLEKKLSRKIGKLIYEKELIKEGDNILLALSGGKDSWSLCYFLKEFQKKAPIKFDIYACTLDVYLNEEQRVLLKKHISDMELPYCIYSNKISEVIQERRRPGSSYCSFCARLRRAYLYEAAQKFRCNKVALGHHLDDAIETYVMNIFYQGRTMGMPAKLKAKNVPDLELIRPLLFCQEKDIFDFSMQMKFPIISCNCDGEVQKDTRRRYVKEFLARLEKDNEGVKQTIMTSMQNVVSKQIF
jgi:tRNA 2-thiocytidine biosynthesis protein TtcA